MTAPTQYNGKPITPVTWLAHAAEVAGEQAESVTVSTRDFPETVTHAKSIIKKLEKNLPGN